MSKSVKMKTAIIGLGNIGLLYDIDSNQFFFTHTKACMFHNGIELLYGVDPDKSKRLLFEGITNKPAYESVDAIDESIKAIDLVILSTPTEFRGSILEQIISMKPKCILVEKPIAPNLVQAIQIKENCERQNIYLFVNYFRYFNPGIQNIYNYFSSGILGDYANGVCYYSGGIANNASHYISMLLQWFGYPRSIQVVEKYQNTSAESNISFKMEFANGDMFFLPLTTNYDIGEIDLFFQNGRIRIENYGENVTSFIAKDDRYFKNYKRLVVEDSEIDDPILEDYQWHVLNTIYEMFSGKRVWRSNIQNAIETIKICDEVIFEAQSTTRFA